MDAVKATKDEVSKIGVWRTEAERDEIQRLHDQEDDQRAVARNWFLGGAAVGLIGLGMIIVPLLRRRRGVESPASTP
jgi:hypothetical protein